MGAEDEVRLHAAIASAAELLPAQGPISLFIHHNTLHALEELPFEQAVVEAADLFGCEPYLSEDGFRDELARGRIEERDLDAALAAGLGASGSRPLAPGLPTRHELRLALLRHALGRPAGAVLDWLLAETDALRRSRPDLDPAARARLLRGHASERAALRSLWHSCLATAAALAPAPPVRGRPPIRHRDLLLQATGEDSDALVHPLLIRTCAAFLDQGIAYWPMPERELGLYAAFLRLYGRRGGGPARWLAGLSDELAALERAEVPPHRSALDSLEGLGVGPAEWEGYVARTLLALRGWAGMLHQVALRPDRVPGFAPPASLLDFLALRLILERRALAHLARRALGFEGPLAELRAGLRARLSAPAPERAEERAYVLFQLAQILGLDPRLLGPESADALLAEADAFGGYQRRRVFQEAYERRYRIWLLDALGAHARRSLAEPDAPPLFQAVLCIDEREESLRRHLEEVEPSCETFGAAGFFGVAMYYRGSEDAHAAPLCPIAIRPRHLVEEIVDPELAELAERRAWLRQRLGRARRAWQVGSRTLGRGTLATALLGTLAAWPLVFRVLLPRATGRLRRRASRLVRPPARTRLLLDPRPDAEVPPGAAAGYALPERVGIVRSLLVETGLARRLASLVFVVGHGSTSLNNPHESAHDCGACGGGRGGPNARAFARMANDPDVRAALAAAGIAIPDGTHFVAAQHDSCSDAIRWFDEEVIPEAQRPLFARAVAAFDTARARNAHERSRRYSRVPPGVTPSAALAHVEARAEDLAQPRPEYGHATNAACVVGRRRRTRGLFLDRRVFLVSYDPQADDTEGYLLERVLEAVAPVCAGINLEYYFSVVDPAGYGCGTKLPHNIAAMLGVMDGHQSDLRTGLPWQMVEIHEPLRLLLVIETHPEVLARVEARSPLLSRLCRNRWLQLATLSPDSDAIHVFDRDQPVRHRPESAGLPTVRSSAEWYAGRRDALPCALLEAREPELRR